MGHAIRIFLDVAVIVAGFGLLWVAAFLLWTGRSVVLFWCREEPPIRPGPAAIRERVPTARPSSRRFRCDCGAGGHDKADQWIECQAARRALRGEGVAS